MNKLKNKLLTWLAVILGIGLIIVPLSYPGLAKADDEPNSYLSFGSNTSLKDSLLTMGGLDPNSLLVTGYLTLSGAGGEGVVAPTVTTLAATDITTSYANIGGTIDNTGGEDGSLVGVEWGTTSGVYTANFTAFVPPYEVGTYITGVATFNSGTEYFYRFFAYNSGGRGDGAEMSLLTKPAAPTGVSASDGLTSANITISWNANTDTVTGYWVLRNGVDLFDTGLVTSCNDTTAIAPTITAGSTVASDSTSNTTITVSIVGQSANNGATYTYTLKAYNATGNSTVSSSDTGYRGHGVLTYQLQRSSGDSDADYSNIVGATSSPYSDVINLAETGRYYKWVLNATGATQAVTTADRGVTSASPSTESSTYISSNFKDIYVILFVLLLIAGVFIIMQAGFVDTREALWVMIGIGIAMIIALYLLEALQSAVTTFW